MGRVQAVAACASAALLVLGSPGAAHEVQIGLQTTMDYDSNIFNSAGDVTDDGIWRFSPSIRLLHEQGDFTYDVRFVPRFETFIVQSDLEAWDYNVAALFGLRLGPRTQIRLSERFLQTRSLNRAEVLLTPEEQVELGVIGQPDIEFNRNLTKQNVVDLSLTHGFSERLTGNLVGQYSIFIPELENNFTSSTYAATGSLDYALTRRTSIGGGLGYTHQLFEQTTTQDTTTTDFYRLFGRLTHQIDPTLTVSLQAGPSFIDSDTADDITQQTVLRFPARNLTTSTEPDRLNLLDPGLCPTLDDGTPFNANTCGIFQGNRRLEFERTQNVMIQGVAGQVNGFYIDSQVLRTDVLDQVVDISLVGDRPDSGSNITFFAAASVVKSWETVTAALRYTRRDSGSSGFGTSTIVDTVTGTLSWEPARKWRLSLSGIWTQQSSATEQAVNRVTLRPLTLRELNEEFGGVLNPEESASAILRDPDDDLVLLVENLNNGLPGNPLGPDGDDRFDLSELPDAQELTDEALDTVVGAEVVALRRVTIDDAIDIQTFGATVRLERELTRQSRVFLDLAYRRQDSARGSVTGGVVLNTYRASLGFVWTFDPWRF